MSGSQLIHRWRAGAALVAVAVLATATVATAQSALVDYETSAKAAQVQQAAAWRLAFRPPMSVLAQTVSQLRAAPGVSPEVAAQVDALSRQAEGEKPPEARRTVWRAVALLTGQAWTPGQELLGALALRSPAPVWTGKGDPLTFEAAYPVPAAARGATYVIDLYSSEPTTSATPKLGARIRTVATGRLGAQPPKSIPISLKDAPDGAYLLVATISAGPNTTGRLVQPIYLVRDLDRRATALKADLASISGHEPAKAIAEYPFALAKALNAGAREIVSYDFPAAISRSQKIVADLKAGRDDVWQAKGLQNRAYRFAETGELVPYQVFAPSAWTPDRKWPLVVALHGANLDETNMLGRNDAQMQKLADRHGFVVVAPLGYRLNSAYGSQRGFSRAIAGDQDERKHRSELDVLRVTELVEAEYNIDPHRRYLTGNSMGGGGTWWIGGQHPELWAALAPGAYGGVLPEDAPGLAKTPIFAVVGDRDELGMLDRVRASLATLRAAGVSPIYLEVSGGTHSSAYDRALPEIFNFFENHAK
ncbi:alpha/beta hydrolase-fold protein [Phenylobacterium aquaticum]|uniref:carboxylesterase family protein n=1 Tax=Phenylobacterium aquaticum TaxID=1763816 RepID=UPI001F5D190A|nr:alpha/beta hydrolase-fold protein [Phenylobacterium aquaticum]MCI3131087.1 alpha/beta hydrolase-fold protein [Phenylobacterium aquaticum]